MNHNGTRVNATNSAISLWSVVQVARSELRSSIRLFRFWFVALVLTGFALGAYALSCMVYINIAPFNASFIGGTPLYLLGNLDPVYFVSFQAGLLVLVFDFRHRARNNRLDEVLESQPVTNSEYMLGRTFCYCGLIWVIVCLNVLAMQFIGFVCQLFNFSFADTIQLHSMFNLLVVDAPVALLFWTSMFLLMTKLIQSRLLIVLACVSVMLGYYLWVLNTPFAFVDLLSHSSNQTLFVSDTMPAFPSATSWIMRSGTFLIAITLLNLGIWFYPRTDSTLKFLARVIPVGSFGVGVLVLSAGVLNELSKSNEISRWQEAHLTYEWDAKLDIQAMLGAIEISPHQKMHIDLIVDFVLTSRQPIQELVFTLNPGYEINTIKVDDMSCEHEFENGLLKLSAPFAIQPETEYSLEIVATGKPHPSFAYFNALYDYLDDTNFPIQAVHSFGTDGSIYNRKFIALMPGVYWYPMPGPVPSARDDDSLRSDFFDVELEVQLRAPSSWIVVGPGISTLDSPNSTRYLVKPNIPIASIGVFASEYVQTSHEFENTTLNFYLHSRHAQNFSAIESYNESLLVKIEEYLKTLEDNQVPIPYQSLSFVEVPNRLRTVGGGWRMERLNSLPGLILIKERGFPTLNFDRLVGVIEKHYGDRANISDRIWVALLGASEQSLESDSLESSVRDQIWSHTVSATGEHRRALNLIFHSMVGSFTPAGFKGLFSVYATAHASRMTGLNLTAATGLNRHRMGMTNDENLRWVEETYGARRSVWARMERTALSSLNFNENSHRHDLEVLRLKSKEIAASVALNRYHRSRTKSASFRNWLTTFRREFTNRTFTYHDVIALAQDFDTDIKQILDDWLTKGTLAGFELSPGTVTRISNSEEGEIRYLFSFDVANTQPVAGYVGISPGNVPAFILSGNTSKRITSLSVTRSESENLRGRIHTYLSLNRDPIWFSIPIDNESIDESLEPKVGLQESNFYPHANDIIIDDLDAGFVVYQSKRQQSQFRFAPQTWLWLSPLHQDFDGGLPDIASVHGEPRGTWVRKREENAYGRYRRTIARTPVRGSMKLPPVGFVAEIPETGQWTLDFYLHKPAVFSPPRFGLQGLKLEISNGSTRWQEEFSSTTSDLGWKTVGEFHLTSGKTEVLIVGATDESFVYADAIRWRKSAEQ